MPLFRGAPLLSIAVLCLFMASPAQAITIKECSTRFENAKASGTLNGLSWSQFRTSQCNIAAESAASDATAKDAPKPAIQIPESVTFPSSVDRKFAAKTPARQRMKTCLESYRVNRDAKQLNGLRWIQKGGGYYSICNARLKGSS